MMTRIATTLISRAFIIALVTVCGTISLSGQCKDKGILRAEVDASNKLIYVEFEAAASDKDKLNDPARWSIGKIGPAASTMPTVVSPITLRSGDSLYPDRYWYAELTYTGSFDPGKYFLYLSNPTFNGCDPKKETFVVMAIQPPPTPPVQYPSTKANGRADADLYVSGGIEGVRKDKAVKTIDLKLELPISAPLFQESQLVIPYIDLKASSNPKADADSLNTGVKLRTVFNLLANPKALKEGEPLVPSKKFFRGIVWDLDGRIEANKNLKFMNGIFANKLAFTTRAFGDGGVQFYIEPSIGLEVGRNMRTPVIEAKDQTIVRPYFGGHAFLNVWIEKPLLETISVQSEYIRRWSITREVGVNKDGDNFVPVFTGKGPRDYVQTKFELGFNKYFGFAVGHEYGRLPPNFKFLNHKFTASLTFKTKLLPRPK